MANIISYVDIIELFTDIAQRHYQINTFFLGKDFELENNDDLMYPVFQVYPSIARMPINAYGSYKTNEITFVCKVIDLTTPDQFNQEDVHSDTLRIAQDIVNEINQHPFYSKSNVSLTGDINFNALEEFEDDKSAGWMFNLTLKIINMNTFCGMPIADLPGFSANGPTSTGTTVNVQYLTCETLPACPTIVTIDSTLVSLQTQINNIPPYTVPGLSSVLNASNIMNAGQFIKSPDTLNTFQVQDSGVQMAYDDLLTLGVYAYASNNGFQAIADETAYGGTRQSTFGITASGSYMNSTEFINFAVNNGVSVTGNIHLDNLLTTLSHTVAIHIDGFTTLTSLDGKSTFVVNNGLVQGYYTNAANINSFGNATTKSFLRSTDGTNTSGIDCFPYKNEFFGPKNRFKSTVNEFPYNTALKLQRLDINNNLVSSAYDETDFVLISGLSNYLGQTSITTLGTITTGTWNGTAIADTYISSATNWNTAYTNRITSLTTTGSGAATLIGNVLNIPIPSSSAFTSLTTTGSSGSSTLLAGVLNVPTYTLSGLGGQPLATNLTSLSGLTYVSASFVKMTAAGTFSLDTNTYLTGNQSITLSGDVTGSGTTAITTAISNATVTGKLLTGYVSGAGTVAATDSILGAIQKLNGNIALKGVGSILGSVAATAGLIPFGTGVADTVTSSSVLKFVTASSSLVVTDGSVNNLGLNQMNIIHSTSATFHIEAVTNTGDSRIRFVAGSDSLTEIFRYNNSAAGNFTGTSLAKAGSTLWINQVTSVAGSGSMVLNAAAVINLIGTTSTNVMVRTDVNGLRIGTLADAHTVNTYKFEVSGAGAPVYINSTNSNQNKIGFADASTIRSYIGASSTNYFTVADNGGVNKFAVGTTQSFINSKLSVGQATLPTANLDIVGSSTSASSLRMLSGTAPTTTAILDGNMYNTSSNVWFTETSLLTKALVGAIYTQSALKTVTNTVTETSLLNSTFTLPANTLTVGKTFKVSLTGYHSGTASPTIRIKIKLGSTIICDTTAVASGNSTNAFVSIDAMFTTYTTGATGTVIGQGLYVEQGGGSATNFFPMTNTATTTIDTTATQVLDVTCTWGTAAIGNTITITTGIIEVIK